MKPLKPVSRARKVALGVAFFVVFVALWSVATLGGFVSKTFLADPMTMLREGYLLFAQHGFAKDVGMTVWRVVGGFILAAVVGVPLGIAMGAFKPIEAFFEPFVSFARYLPGVGVHSALDPLGGHRRSAEASRDLHRRVLPDRADGRGHRGLDAPRPGRSRVHARREFERHRAPRPAAERGTADRGDAAARARLGVDLRDRRRADRRVVRHRSHDHRLASAAQHGPDHLRHHRDRRHRTRSPTSRSSGPTRSCIPWSLA